MPSLSDILRDERTSSLSMELYGVFVMLESTSRPDQDLPLNACSLQPLGVGRGRDIINNLIKKVKERVSVWQKTTLK
jgi:hypothetical protein